MLDDSIQQIHVGALHLFTVNSKCKNNIAEHSFYSVAPFVTIIAPVGEFILTIVAYCGRIEHNASQPALWMVDIFSDYTVFGWTVEQIIRFV